MVASRMCVRALLVLACLALAAKAIPVSFNHGVASGDPLPDGIILWTRVTPREVVPSNSTYDVHWVVATSKTFKSKFVVATGIVTTGPERDYTVKVDVRGLQKQGVQHFYRFFVRHTDRVAGSDVTYTVESPFGGFRLPHPKGSDKQKSLRYALFSCSNWGWGYFNAYDMASRYNLDFWVHLGDYIYEYGLTSYPGAAQAVRWRDPSYAGLAPQDMILSLDDYRKRHALYREDPGLQALSATAPLLSIWDDHEFTNNARKNTAQNHVTSRDGPWEDRKTRAVKAYYEWMPIREIEDGKYINFAINKTLYYGNLAKIYLLEERVTARTDEVLPSTSTADESTNKYPAPDINTRVAQIAAGKKFSELNSTDIAAIQAIKDFGLSIANNASYTIDGVEQLAWLDAETKEAKAEGIKWSLYHHGTVSLPNYYLDFEAAIAKATENNPSQAARWEKYYRAVAYGEGNMTESFGNTCYNRPYLGQPLAINSGMTASIRTQQVLGRYLIPNYFDAFYTMFVNKRRLYEIASQVDNAVSYAGDSHADWAGINQLNGQTVMAEYDVTGVTSPALESDAYLPLDLLSAAATAAGYPEGLRFSYFGNKGFLLVELNDKVHHGEYIKVDNVCSMAYTPTCVAAFDYYSKEERERRGVAADLHPSRCGRLPSGLPYSKILRLNTQEGQQFAPVR